MDKTGGFQLCNILASVILLKCLWFVNVGVLIAILLLFYELLILQAKWTACYAIHPMHSKHAIAHR